MPRFDKIAVAGILSRCADVYVASFVCAGIAVPRHDISAAASALRPMTGLLPDSPPLGERHSPVNTALPGITHLNDISTAGRRRLQLALNGPGPFDASQSNVFVFRASKHMQIPLLLAICFFRYQISLPCDHFRRTPHMLSAIRAGNAVTLDKLPHSFAANSVFFANLAKRFPGLKRFAHSQFALGVALWSASHAASFR